MSGQDLFLAADPVPSGGTGSEDNVFQSGAAPTAIQQTVRGNFQVWEYRQTHAELLGLDLDLMYRFSNTLSIQYQSSLVKMFNRKIDWPIRFSGRKIF